MRILPPARSPCGSCPYRRDVPSGIWDRVEYEKLPPFDRETAHQPSGVFLCHQQDGRACAGWCGVHDLAESLGMRIAVQIGMIAPDDVDAFLDYETDVPLFSSGAEAAAHGLAEIDRPTEGAVRAIRRLEARRARR